VVLITNDSYTNEDTRNNMLEQTSNGEKDKVIKDLEVSTKAKKTCRQDFLQQ
jgi:hypothetical protein